MKQLSILFRGTLGFPFPVSGAFALCLLLLASCGGDDSSDEGYAAIESASFTFDETTPANNAVRVIANTGWQVFWTPGVGCRPGGTRLGFPVTECSTCGTCQGRFRSGGRARRLGQCTSRQAGHRDPRRRCRRGDALGRSRRTALRSGLARIERRHRDDERFVESGMSQFRAEVLARLGYGQRHDHHCRRARGAAHHADRYGRRRLRRQDCNLRDRAQSGRPPPRRFSASISATERAASGRARIRSGKPRPAREPRR